MAKKKAFGSFPKHVAKTLRAIHGEPKERLFLVTFHGKVYPLGVGKCPLRRHDFDTKEEFETCRDMTAGDSFSFNERRIIHAVSPADARACAEGLIIDWHKAHWSDCEWSIGYIKEVSTFEDLIKELEAS